MAADLRSAARRNPCRIRPSGLRTLRQDGETKYRSARWIRCQQGARVGGICRGLLRFGQEGTRKTPRERCIVMRCPRGISYKSDGDDALWPALGRAKGAGAEGCRRREREMAAR